MPKVSFPSIIGLWRAILGRLKAYEQLNTANLQKPPVIKRQERGRLMTCVRHLEAIKFRLCQQDMARKSRDPHIEQRIGQVETVIVKNERTIQ